MSEDVIEGWKRIGEQHFPGDALALHGGEPITRVPIASVAHVGPWVDDGGEPRVELRVPLRREIVPVLGGRCARVSVRRQESCTCRSISNLSCHPPGSKPEMTLTLREGPPSASIRRSRSPWNRPAFLSRPHDLRRLRAALLGGRTEPVLGSLRRDAADGRADFTPAGAVLPGRLGRSVTEPIRRSPKQVSEAKGSQRPVGLGRHARNCFPQTALHQVVRECLRIQ